MGSTLTLEELSEIADFVRDPEVKITIGEHGEWLIQIGEGNAAGLGSKMFLEAVRKIKEMREGIV